MLRFLVLFGFLLAIPLHATVVYFGTGGKGEGIYRARLNLESGQLSKIQLAAAVNRPGFLTFHPQRTVLYAVAEIEKEPVVAAYRIEADGSLIFYNASPIGDGGGCHIAVHPSGRFLLTAQYGGGSVAVFPLQPDGRVGERSQLIEHEGASGVVANRQAAPHPHWVGFSPDGRFAFVPDLGLDQIITYRVDQDLGRLEADGVIKALPGSGPRHMRFSRDGRFIYLLNELSLSVTTFAYHPETGRAERLSTAPALSEKVKAEESFNSSSEIIIHPNGRFIYTGNRGHDSVTAYEADIETGELNVIEVEPIRGSWPRNINMDVTGRWLLAAGRKSNTVAVFEVDPESGELTFPRNRVFNIPDVMCILLND
ncbi:MAG: lactonase family protein [Verrucomicrobiota bacterium]